VNQEESEQSEVDGMKNRELITQVRRCSCYNMKKNLVASGS